MNCTDATQRIEERPLGLLDDAEAEALAAHLATCAECAAVAEALDAIHAELANPQGDPVSLSPDLRERVIDAMDAVYTEEALTAKSKGLVVAEAADPRTVAAVGAKISLACSYCHDRTQRAELVFCAACLAPHHEECFAEHGRCSMPGCEERSTVRPTAQSEPEPRAHRRRWRGRGLTVFALAVGLPAAAFGVYSANAYKADAEAHAWELAQLAKTEQLRTELDAQLVESVATAEEIDRALERIERLIQPEGSIHEIRRARGSARVAVNLLGDLDSCKAIDLMDRLERDQELPRLVQFGSGQVVKLDVEPPACRWSFEITLLPDAERRLRQAPTPTELEENRQDQEAARQRVAQRLAVLKVARRRALQLLGGRDVYVEPHALDVHQGVLVAEVRLEGRLDEGGLSKVAALRRMLQADPDLRRLARVEGLSKARVHYLDPPVLTSELRLVVLPDAYAALQAEVPEADAERRLGKAPPPAELDAHDTLRAMQGELEQLRKEHAERTANAEGSGGELDGISDGERERRQRINATALERARELAAEHGCTLRDPELKWKANLLLTFQAKSGGTGLADLALAVAGDRWLVTVYRDPSLDPIHPDPEDASRELMKVFLIHR